MMILQVVRQPRTEQPAGYNMYRLPVSHVLDDVRHRYFPEQPRRWARAVSLGNMVITLSSDLIFFFELIHLPESPSEHDA